MYRKDTVIVPSSAWLLVPARMIHFLVVLSLYLSLPPKLSLGGLDDGDSVIVPLDGGHGDRPSQVLGVVAGGNKDDPLHSGNVSVYISPTPVVLRQP